MDYNFLTLNSRDFEHLIQSLSQKILGNNSLVFGDGADGARELTYTGKAHFPNTNSCGDGYWVIQAKFKSKKISNEDDFNWIKANFITEMNKFKSKKRKLKTPDNYIFFTNASLTPVHESGGKDRIEELKKLYENLISNIHFITYDELCRLLDNNRDVATAYSSFILTGDILKKLFDLLQYENNALHKTKNIFLTYLEKTFKSEMFSKLIQAGDATNQQVNIEKVFIDIDVSSTDTKKEKFLKFLINTGDNKANVSKNNMFVLVGGAGSGKSTLSQYISQIYSAFFIVNNREFNINENIERFVREFEICAKPSCIRFPFKIILKDYASWVKTEKELNNSTSVLSYLKQRIELLGDDNISSEILRDFLRSVSLLVIFDGLDEVPATSNRDEVLREINDFIDIELRNLGSDSVILCTTRQQGYSKDFNENFFQHLYVSELSDEDCELYLKKLLENIEPSLDDRVNYLNTLKEAIKDSVTGRLMRTPLQATIMTILVKSGGKPSRNKYNLFKDYYDTIYRREVQKEVQPFLKDYRRYIDAIHSLLGFELQVKSEHSENPSAIIDSSEFEELITAFLKIKEEWKENEIKSFINRLKNIVTERLVFIGELQEGKIGFVVRSLQEYFAANYLISYPDNDVTENIGSIARSAYWRNTYLFAVSGLHNTKSHLIDSVYLICEKLNGNDEDVKSVSLNRTLMYGSFLSLDILSEGIFSDSAKYTNRFSNLLDRLFTNVITSDLSKMQFLQKEIIRDFLLQKTIRQTLTSANNFNFKYSCFNACFTLLSNNEFETKIDAILSECWDEKNEVELLQMLIEKNAVNSNFFLNQIFHIIKNKNHFDYLAIIRSGISSSKNFVNLLLERFKKDDEFMRKMIELIFFSLMRNPIRKEEKETFSVFELLTNKKFHVENGTVWGMLGYNYNELRFEISDSFSVTLNSIKSNNVNLDAFIELFEKYSLPHLTSFIKFTKKPSVASLKNLLIELKNRNSDIAFDFIIKQSRVWLFQKYFSDYHVIAELDHMIKLVDNGEVGDYKNWIKFEDRLQTELDYDEILDYATLFTTSGSSSIILNEFYKKFKDKINLSQNITFEFLKLYSRIDEDSEEEKFVVSKDISEKVISGLRSFKFNEERPWKVNVVKSTLLTLINQIYIHEVDQIEDGFFDLFGQNQPRHYLYDESIVLPVINKCIGFYNSRLSLGKNSQIEILIVYLFSYVNDNMVFNISKINFRETFIDYTNDSIYRLILKLLSTDIQVDVDSLIIRLNDEEDATNWIHLIVKITWNCKIQNKWCIPFLIKIHEILALNEQSNIYIIQHIEQLLKFYVENEMTNINRLQLIDIKDDIV
jgi:hypothetical protein